MTQGAHDGGGFGQSAGGNAARGILVIVVAVAIGLLLLQQGLSSSDEADVAATDTPAADAGDAATSDTTSVSNIDSVPEETTSSTLGVARPASEVAVLVLNGTDGPVAGVAGDGTNKLKTENYITKNPKNATDADGNPTPSPSAVFYVEGFEAEAVVVAQVLGASPELVVKPLDPATVPVTDTQGANIVVVVGNDGVIVV